MSANDALNPNEDRNDRRRDFFYKIKSEKGALRRFAARKLFPILERAGLHLTADHFYEIIPNTREVAKNYSHEPRPCHGIDFHPVEAEARLLRLLDAYAGEFYAQAATQGYYEDNAYFRGADGLTLYCMIRDLKPRRVIEIGHGFSTRVVLAALARNGEESGTRPQFLSVDPYARFVPASASSVDFEVISKPLQDSVGLVTGTLQEGDMLFVDSTHVYKVGSDVEVYFDQLYPQIPAGVHIHVHDIFSPYQYPLSWIAHSKRFWNEQYMLESFLAFNASFEVTLPLHLLMRQSQPVQDAMKAIIKGGDYLFTGQSIYLRRTA